MVVSKRWFESCPESKFRYPLFTYFLPQFCLCLTSFLPFFNLNLTSASLQISNHGLETTVCRLLGFKVEKARFSSPEVLGSPRTSPDVPRTSPEVLRRLPRFSSLTVELNSPQRFPGSFPDFPGSSPNFPGSSRTSPEVSPFLWEAWHPLLTHKNFLWEPP